MGSARDRRRDSRGRRSRSHSRPRRNVSRSRDRPSRDDRRRSDQDERARDVRPRSRSRQAPPAAKPPAEPAPAAAGTSRPAGWPSASFPAVKDPDASRPFGWPAPKPATPEPSNELPDWLKDLEVPIKALSAPAREAARHRTLKLKSVQIRVLLGRGGETIRMLEDQGKTSLRVDHDRQAEEGELHITGNPDGAEALIRKTLKEKGCPMPGDDEPDPEEADLYLPEEMVGIFVGKGGEHLKVIKQALGGMLWIGCDAPPGGVGKWKISIVGDHREKAKEMVRARLREIWDTEARKKEKGTGKGKGAETGPQQTQQVAWGGQAQSWGEQSWGAQSQSWSDNGWGGQSQSWGNDGWGGACGGAGGEWNWECNQMKGNSMKGMGGKPSAFGGKGCGMSGKPMGMKGPMGCGGCAGYGPGMMQGAMTQQNCQW